MPSDEQPLDKTDLHILALLTQHTVWKQRVHDLLHAADHPDTAVSVQTVGRRISRLRDRGYVDTEIIQPDGIRRGLIAAYTTTDDGAAALAQYRICPDCGELMQPDDHTHQPLSADQYFSPA